MNKIEELQKQIEDSSNQIAENLKLIETEEQKGSEANQAIIASARENIAMLEADRSRAQGQIDELQNLELMQETERREITLPYDFNDIFDSHSANDMIIELIKDVQRKSDLKHLERVAEICSNHDEQLRAASDREAQLQRQNREMQIELHGSNQMIAVLRSDLQTSEELRLDAEQKRDNAGAQLAEKDAEISRLNQHIDDLRRDLANAPAPKAAIEIEGTSKLDELVKQARESTAEKANRALTRWGFEPLEVPQLPAPQEGPFRQNTETEFGDDRIPAAETTENVNQFRTEDIPSDPVQTDTTDGEVAGQNDTDMERRIEALERRVSVLENMNMGAVA